MWNAFQISFYHFLITTLRDKYPSYPQFDDNRTEAEGGLVTFPWSQHCQAHQDPRYEAKCMTANQPSQLLHHSAPPQVWGSLSKSLEIREDLAIFFPSAFLSFLKLLHLPCITIEIRKKKKVLNRKKNHKAKTRVWVRRLTSSSLEVIVWL